MKRRAMSWGAASTRAITSSARCEARQLRTYCVGVRARVRVNARVRARVRLRLRLRLRHRVRVRVRDRSQG